MTSITGYRNASGANLIPKGYTEGKLNRFTPQQMQLFSDLFQHVSPQSQLGQLAGGNPQTFEALEAPAKREFSQQLGNIANRFSGQGLGGRSSSGFNQATTAAASDFASQLQSNRQQLQRQALNDLMALSQSLLGQQPFESFLVQKDYGQNDESSFLEKLMGALAPLLGSGAGALLGGMPGASLGGQLGSMFGSAFR